MATEALSGAVEGAAAGKLSRISDVGPGYVRVQTPWASFTLNITDSSNATLPPPFAVVEKIDPNAAFVMPVRKEHFTEDFAEAQHEHARAMARHKRPLAQIFPIIEGGGLPEEHRRPEVLRVATYPKTTF